MLKFELSQLVGLSRSSRSRLRITHLELLSYALSCAMSKNQTSRFTVERCRIRLNKSGTCLSTIARDVSSERMLHLFRQVLNTVVNI
jgi:hypothetical protein